MTRFGAIRGSKICCAALGWNSNNCLAFVLVAGNAEGFQRGQQIVRSQARSWIIGKQDVIRAATW